MLIIQVEDTKNVAKERASKLRQMGHDVRFAFTLNDARLLYRKYREQEAVMTFDYSLPDGEKLGTTLELIRDAVKDQAMDKCRLLLVAASSFQQKRDEQLEAGCTETISDFSTYTEDVADIADLFQLAIDREVCTQCSVTEANTAA